jgi:hypothetical protein
MSGNFSNRRSLRSRPAARLIEGWYSHGLEGHCGVRNLPYPGSLGLALALRQGWGRLTGAMSLSLDTLVHTMCVCVLGGNACICWKDHGLGPTFSQPQSLAVSSLQIGSSYWLRARSPQFRTTQQPSNFQSEELTPGTNSCSSSFPH